MLRMHIIHGKSWIHCHCGASKNMLSALEEMWMSCAANLKTESWITSGEKSVIQGGSSLF